MAPPLYRPPNKVVQINQSILTLVNRVDPDYERLKHWDAEHVFSNKVFYKDPTQMGAFNTPVKRVTLGYANQVVNAGDLTPAPLPQPFSNYARQALGYVYANANNPAPGTLTTRTGAQMFSEWPNAAPLAQYRLRLSSTGGGLLTLAPGAGVDLRLPGRPLNPTLPIKNGTFSEFIVTFVDAATVTMQLDTTNNSYGSVSH
jgi:hypothetical protein